MTAKLAPRTTPCKEETPQLLIVEGKDDCNGIFHIASHYGLEEQFGIWEAGSDTGALERFGGLLLSSTGKPTVLGIVLDCDSDHEGNVQGTERRWAQIEHRLGDLGYEVPDRPNANGTIISSVSDLPKIGVWLMPDNLSDGMFEDYLLPLMPEEHLAYAEKTVVEVQTLGIGNYKTIHKSKAVAHTYLAWQDEPGRPLGLAIKSHLFDVRHPRALPFVNWLRELFLPQEQLAGTNSPDDQI